MNKIIKNRNLIGAVLSLIGSILTSICMVIEVKRQQEYSPYEA
jgi:hypothetical protein